MRDANRRAADAPGGGRSASAARDGGPWQVLGFTYDAVVGANQDWRLARQCAEALEGLGVSGVVAAAGCECEHIIEWFVNQEASERLDAAGVPWRRFWVRQCAHPPAHARPILLLSGTTLPR